MSELFWRRDPEVEPASVGVDPAALDRIAALFAGALEDGRLCHGAQLALYRGGQRVLDVGGGLARPRTGERVSPDTLFVTFSATKGLAALVLWRLYERGAFHFDEPVVRYWPEFADAIEEKREVTLRHVMSHRSGFPEAPEWFTARHWADREATARAMREAPLRWSPGARNGYHPMNFGHVLNELLLRIEGRDCGELLREEVVAPLRLGDLHLGLPDDPSLEQRVAWVAARSVRPGRTSVLGVGADEAEDGPARPSAAALPEQVPERYRETPELAHPLNRPAVQRLVLPAAGAIATARDLGAVYAALVKEGQTPDPRLLRSDSLDHAATPTNRAGDVDETLRLPIRWGTGWHLGDFGRGSSLRSFGHGGAGGQLAFADRDRALAFAIVTTGEREASYLPWRIKLQSLAFGACRD